MKTLEKQNNDIKSKMIAENIKNFSKSELHRVFQYTVAPHICLTIARSLIKGGLTIDKLYN